MNWKGFYPRHAWKKFGLFHFASPPAPLPSLGEGCRAESRRFRLAFYDCEANTMQNFASRKIHEEWINHTTHTIVCVVCGGKNQKRLAQLWNSNAFLCQTAEERLIVFFEFVVPGEDGLVFQLAGAGRHGIIHGHWNSVGLALLVLKIHSSFPKDNIIDQILVHGILLIVSTGKLPD